MLVGRVVSDVRAINAWYIDSNPYREESIYCVQPKGLRYMVVHILQRAQPVGLARPHQDVHDEVDSNLLGDKCPTRPVQGRAFARCSSP
jgi:hypothetical protein